DGTAVTDVDGNRTDVGAGTITVADAAGETVIGGNQVSVGGDNPIVISGDTGTIGGLTNRTFDPDDITNGQAATEDQLGSVYEVANAGWNVSAQGENATNVGVNSETGNAVDLKEADGNSVITKADDSNDITFDLAENIDLGEGGSLTTGNTVVNNAGVTVEDEDGNVTTVAAGGTTTTDGAGNSTAVGAGTVTVTDAAGETVIGGSHVSVGGDNPILISGDTGTIGGLTNLTFDPDNIVSGQAATEDQLGQVYDVANAGWNVSAQGANATNVGVNSQTGNTVDLNNADGNIVVTKADDSNDVTFDLADDITVDSVTAGDSVLDTDGLVVTDADGNVTTVAADGTTVEDDEGNVTTVAADGTSVSDADGNNTAIGAGTVAVTDADGNTTTIGGSQISVGGTHTIVIDGDAGTIGGLQNQTIDYPEFADGSGRAATEEQLAEVNETATA